MTYKAHTVSKRALTPNERAHAELMLALRRWHTRLFILLGSLFWVLAVVQVWLVWRYTYLLSVSSSFDFMWSFLYVGCLLFLIFGGWRCLMMGVRKIVLGDEVHLLKGPFSTVYHRGGGNTPAWTEYFVGDVSLRLPFLVNLDPSKNSGTEIEVAAVYLYTYPKKYKWFDKYQDPEAIVLFIEGQVDIEQRGR